MKKRHKIHPPEHYTKEYYKNLRLKYVLGGIVCVVILIISNWYNVNGYIVGLAWTLFSMSVIQVLYISFRKLAE